MKYIAPETISGKKYNHMSDWWSLGVIIYRMLTGNLPHPTNVNRKIPYFICNYKIPLNPEVFSPAAFDFLEKLLERDPTKRLGAGGIEEIKNHIFFKSVNWKRAYSRKLKPPYIPKNMMPKLGNFILNLFFHF